MRVGERFSLPEEGIFGVVAEIFYDSEQQPASAVIQMDDGRWASVDLSLIQRVSVH